MGQGYGKTVLAGYADKNRVCYPTRKTLLKDCGFGEARFDKAMNELVNAGVVSKERSKKGNLLQNNTYTLHDTS